MDNTFEQQGPIQQPAGTPPGESPRMDREEGNLKHGKVGGNLEPIKEETEAQQYKETSLRNENTRLNEQKAPYKNTDKAHVKVNKDGSPGL